MLNAAELAQLAAVQAATLADTATIHRRTFTPDGMGGQTESTTTATAACRIAPARPADIALMGGQVRELALFRVTFAAGTDVRTGDRLEVKGRGMEVLGIFAPETFETARAVLAVER